MDGFYSLADSRVLNHPRFSSCYSNIRISKLRHPNLKRIIEIVGPLPLKVPIWKSINKAVLYAVIGQMLSSKASSSIIKRLLYRFETAGRVISWAEKSAYRQGAVCGVSKRKRLALKAWSEEAKKRGRFWNDWPQMSFEEFKGDVTSIWGFGDWAAGMIAIFYLGRMDVWPETDTGIQNMSKQVFGTSEAEEIKEYIKGFETIVALYFWECLNRGLRISFNGRRHG